MRVLIRTDIASYAPAVRDSGWHKTAARWIYLHAAARVCFFDVHHESAACHVSADGSFLFSTEMPVPTVTLSAQAVSSSHCSRYLPHNLDSKSSPFGFDFLVYHHYRPGTEGRRRNRTRSTATVAQPSIHKECSVIASCDWTPDAIRSGSLCDARMLSSARGILVAMERSDCIATKVGRAAPSIFEGDRHGPGIR
jgi:hypothetical protein